MKYSSLLVLTLLTIVGCNGKRENSSGQVTSDSLSTKIDSVRIGSGIFQISDISKDEFEKQAEVFFDKEEKNNLLKDSSLVKRVGDSLILKLSNGKEILMTNTKGENYGSYRYMGRLSGIGHYFIRGVFDEWSTNYLISELTGDTTEVCGVPIISPDSKFLIAGNADLVAGFTYNGFNLFSVENKSLKSIGRRELSEWGPKSIKWVNSQEIVAEIKVRKKDSSKGRLEYTKYIKLRME